MQSQLGPASARVLTRKPSGTPPVSATQRPAARSSMHPRTSHAALGGGGSFGFSVHALSTHVQVPGSGAESLHVSGSDASTHRVGLHVSSHPQSLSLSHAANER
jgi:hypothetical protein